MTDEGQSRLRYLFMRVPTVSAWTASRRNVSTFYQHDTSRAEIRNVPAYLDKFHRPHARRLNSTGDAACRHRQEGALLLRRLGGHLVPSLRRFCVLVLKYGFLPAIQCKSHLNLSPSVAQHKPKCRRCSKSSAGRRFDFILLCLLCLGYRFGCECCVLTRAVR